MSRMPQIKAKELIVFLKKNGFTEERQSGSHLTMYCKKSNISVTIPIHTGCDIGRGLAIRVLKEAGYSVDDYLKRR